MKLYAEVVEEGRSLLEKKGIALEKKEENKSQIPDEPITAEKLTEYISLLENSCNDFDGDETVRIAEEALAYSYDDKPLRIWLDRIAEYAADFEYDSALEELEKMRTELCAGKEHG